MTKPTIHLNGTSPESLLEGYSDAARTLREALCALDAASPNARDYYPQGEKAYRLAEKEHSNRVVRIREVLEEINELAEHVADEVDSRRG